MKKLRVGRQPSLEKDRQLTERVCARLAEGVSIQAAMNLSGVAERSYHDWMRRGQAGEEPYEAFFVAASRARDSWKARLIQCVESAAQQGEWRAAAFLLERQFPAEFGPKHEEGERGSNGLLPPSAPGPIIHVTVQRDEATDEARKRFGTPPPNRTRYRTLPEDPVHRNQK